MPEPIDATAADSQIGGAREVFDKA